MNPDGSRFRNIPALEEITFDDGWQHIRGYVFFSITSTVTITIPKGVESIGAPIFANKEEKTKKSARMRLHLLQ